MEEVATLISKTDIDSFVPSHSVEAQAPKSRYCFRIANQLLLLDAILFMSGVIEVAHDLETLKAIAAASLPAFAGTCTVTFKKMVLSGGGDIRSIKVWNAISQTQVPKNEGETFSIEVTLPEGECTARMAIFPSGGGRINARYEICSGRTLNLFVP